MRGNKTLRSNALRASTNLTNLNATDVLEVPFFVFIVEKNGAKTNTRSSRDCAGKNLFVSFTTRALPYFLLRTSLSSSSSLSSKAPFLSQATTIGVAVAIEQSKTGHSPGTPSSYFFAQNDAYAVIQFEELIGENETCLGACDASISIASMALMRTMS